MARAHPGRFAFRLPEIDELQLALDEIGLLFVKYGKAGIQIVCTVSPVALGDTFRAQDVGVANCYSKALNRVAVEKWVSENENVHYFPNYEMVTSSDPRVAWEEDMRHPSKKMVARVVEAFEQGFLVVD